MTELYINTILEKKMKVLRFFLNTLSLPYLDVKQQEIVDEMYTTDKL